MVAYRSMGYWNWCKWTVSANNKIITAENTIIRKVCLKKGIFILCKNTKKETIPNTKMIIAERDAVTTVIYNDKIKRNKIKKGCKDRYYGCDYIQNKYS